MDTGCEAPMFVPGDITAILEAIVTNTPADAAWEPLGETNTIMGISEVSKSLTIYLVDFNNPPGVFNSITRHSAFLL